MKEQFAVMNQLRRVLTQTTQGSGLSAALVKVFSGEKGPARDVARVTFLGFPPGSALSQIIATGKSETSMLATLLAGAGKGSRRIVGKRGEEFAAMMENWMKASENREMLEQVIRFRALVISGVLGGLLAMLSNLGPLIGLLQSVGASPTPDLGGLELLGSSMAAVSSFALGLFTGGRSYIYDVLIAMAVFWIVSAAVSPLFDISGILPWGVK